MSASARECCVAPSTTVACGCGAAKRMPLTRDAVLQCGAHNPGSALALSRQREGATGPNRCRQESRWPEESDVPACIADGEQIILKPLVIKNRVAAQAGAKE